MVYLNLISLAEKKQVRLTRIYIILKKIAVFVLVFILFLIFSSTLTRYILIDRLTQITTQPRIQFNNPFETKIKKYNEDLAVIQKIQKDFIPWSYAIAQFSVLIPDGVEITSLDIDQKKKIFSAAGKAKLRDNFLTLEASLKKSDSFQDINYPMSILLEKENIEFTIMGEVVL